ncbi:MULTISPECIES: thioesterase II family protein [Bacillus cereus group]|uniref:Thioesterase n=1 Tax=Bacillus cereus TaxID=1396 RepID=A0A9W7UWU6_BACCE|nr:MULTISPECIES: thioesterase domain-containing protein [Bacillus cereus group]KAB2395346.1 thioesterase [Bacillus cereus]KAB2408100.1 thioesterase [Bacillus cereus]KAB2430941.1 thioesterase [Bacillus cereus]OPD59674.1 hypothetical protein BVG01_06515 [Bacillus anthracis]CUB39897.1 Linear gramicidin dehydrogenase LgrE [Bacillus cereus]
MNQDNKWIGLKRKVQNPKLRLFAFHYAGGGASSFKKWTKDLIHHDSVEFYAIQLPGREKRVSEEAYTELNSLIQDLVEGLDPLLDKPFVLFGYSMGSIIAYELTLELLKRGGYEQKALMIGAQKAPIPRFPRKKRHHLSNEKIIEELKILGGTSLEILENEKFMEHYLKIFRADFAIVDNYMRDVSNKIQFPLYVFGSINDPEVSLEQLYSWRHYSKDIFELKLYPGGHFFLDEHYELLMNDINEILEILTEEKILII